MIIFWRYSSSILIQHLALITQVVTRLLWQIHRVNVSDEENKYMFFRFFMFKNRFIYVSINNLLTFFLLYLIQGLALGLHALMEASALTDMVNCLIIYVTAHYITMDKIANITVIMVFLIMTKYYCIINLTKHKPSINICDIVLSS